MQLIKIGYLITMLGRLMLELANKLGCHGKGSRGFRESNVSDSLRRHGQAAHEAGRDGLNQSRGVFPSALVLGYRSAKLHPEINVRFPLTGTDSLVN